MSNLVDFTATKEADGTTTILLNGSVPLLIGDKQYSLTAALASPSSPPALNANAPPQAQFGGERDQCDGSNHGEPTGRAPRRTQHDSTVVSGRRQSAWKLEWLAQGLADRVDQLLTSGNISDGPPTQPGVPLFTYDTSSPVRVAATLSVDPSVTPAQLAAISPGPPEVSNRVPLALSQLANPTDSADEIDGFSLHPIL